MSVEERIEHEFALDLLDDCITNAAGPDREKLKNVRGHYVTWMIADRQAQASGLCAFCKQMLYSKIRENILNAQKP